MEAKDEEYLRSKVKEIVDNMVELAYLRILKDCLHNRLDMIQNKGDLR